MNGGPVCQRRSGCRRWRLCGWLLRRLQLESLNRPSYFAIIQNGFSWDARVVLAMGA